MDKINELNKKIRNFLEKKQNKKLFLIILLGAVGILFISLSELVPPDSEEIEISENNYFKNSREYEEFLEKRIEDEISKISGAGETSVMLTLDSSEEFSYAQNSTEEIFENESARKSEIITVENGSYETPVIVKTTEAKIRGILVICKGGDDPFVSEKIIESLRALLDVPSNRISVAKMA